MSVQHREFDATRDLSRQAFRSLCYAPLTSLYFDTRGNARVCCHNWSHPVGNVRQHSLDEIWNGAALQRLREALIANDLSLGCRFCEWQLAGGGYEHAAIHKWDRLPVKSRTPQWPQMMEFSISNTCNLACVMCDGNHSSLIRRHREHLPPLANPYSSTFFEELRKYLFHLRRARFLGGEPFLQRSCYRIWDMLVEERLALPCHVTTNGTVLNARIEAYLQAMPFSVSVSLDGMTKATFERVRVNAKFEAVLANVRRFREYTAGRNTHFGLTFCLMRENWQEFGDFCLFAEDLECSAGVNLVRKPAYLSLFTLEPAELETIVARLRHQDEVIRPQLVRTQALWIGELERLSRHARGVSSVAFH